jgi:hypothetical protein
LSFDQSNFRLKSDGSIGVQPAQNKLQDEATEHTLAGSVIGVVRSVIPGLKGTAQSNDQIANIAADTIASIPMVKTVASGAIRATMLIDPTKDAETNARSFGLNFVEGVALNKVSRLAMPESGLSNFLSTKLGTGLAAESATHLTVGLGFGAVRTGFNTENWKDSQGNFSLSTGAENLIKGSATGALVNLPAGLLGFRVAKASSVMLESGAVTPRLASVITGAGSGYAAGGVYGGLDAVMSGKSFPDVLKSINEGGMIGAASGGLMGSFDGWRIVNSNRSAKSTDISTMAVERTSAEKPMAVERPTDVDRPTPQDSIRPRDMLSEISEADNVSRFSVDPAKYEAMSIKPREMPPIVEVQNRLTSVEVRPEKYEYLDPQAKGPWKDFSDFATNLKSAEKDFRVYKVDNGNIEIALPEAYAKQLDEVRALRIKAEKPSILDNLPPGQHIAVQNMVRTGNVATFKDFYSDQEATQILPILSARIKLADHPLGNRALPEDFVTMLDELPTRTNIKRLTISDERFSQDAWHKQDYKPTFQAAATAAESIGGVDFYQPNRADQLQSTFRDSLRGTLFHEHGHLVPPKNTMYADASLLEKDGYYVTDYSKRNNDERWTEDRAKAWLHPDVDKFLEMSEKGPIRSVVIAQEFIKQAGSLPPAEQSVYAKQFWNRVKFTDEQVLPLAREQMVAQLKSKDANVQDAALRLLDNFGTGNELDAVVAASHHAATPDIQRRAFDLAIKLVGPDLKKQFDFVFEQGLPESPVRELAIRRLRYYGTVDERAPSYTNLLIALARNDLPELAKMVTRMQTNEGSELAYQYAMDKGRHVEGYQRAVALSALEEVPSLRIRALNTLDLQPPDFIAPVVGKFVNDSDPIVAGLARDVLRGVELRTTIQNANRIVAKGGTVHPDVIAALGNSGNPNASVPPLLDIIAKGPDSTRPLALDALAKFDTNIVKYYARYAKKELTADQAQNLEQITNNKFRNRNLQFH